MGTLLVSSKNCLLLRLFLRQFVARTLDHSGHPLLPSHSHTPVTLWVMMWLLQPSVKSLWETIELFILFYTFLTARSFVNIKSHINTCFKKALLSRLS